MKENWYALCVAILNPEAVTVERAFELLNTGKVNKYAPMSREDLEDAVLLRASGMKLKELAETYGRTESSMCRFIRKYESVGG